MEPEGKPFANTQIVLREEFDDWAILFDPDTGNAFGLNPTGVLVWKCLDGRHTVDQILAELRSHADGVPENARQDLVAFIRSLVDQGLAGFEVPPATGSP